MEPSASFSAQRPTLTLPGPCRMPTMPPLPLPNRSTSVSAGEVHQIVRNYLLHYGYADTLAAFDTAAGMAEGQGSAGTGGGAMQPAEAAVQQQPPQQQQQGPASPAAGAGGSSSSSSSTAREAAAAALLPLRAQLRQQLMAGDTAAAQALLQQQAPELLSARASTAGAAGSGFELRFHLACQHYIELIRCVPWWFSKPLGLRVLACPFKAFSAGAKPPGGAHPLAHPTAAPSFAHCPTRAGAATSPARWATLRARCPRCAALRPTTMRCCGMSWRS